MALRCSEQEVTDGAEGRVRSANIAKGSMGVPLIKGLNSEWGKMGGERGYQELNGIRTGKTDREQKLGAGLKPGTT